MNFDLPRARVLSLIIALFVFNARADEETNQTAATPPATEAPAATELTTTNVAPAAETAPAPPSAEPTTPNGAPAATEQPPPPQALEDMSKEEMIKMLKDLTGELRDVRQELNQIETERALEAEQKAKTTGARAPAPVVPAPQPAEQPKTEVKAVENEDQARIERERAIRSVARNSVLLPPGAVEVEPAASYSHFSSNLIDIEGFAILPVLVLGQIESLRIERDTYSPVLTLRYGILNGLQADASAGYRFETDRFVRQIQGQSRNEEIVTDEGVTDTQFGLTYQVLYEHGLIPDVTINAHASAPTGKSQFDINSTNSSPTELAQGSGVWNVRAGMSATKSLDPAVIIFTAGYTVSMGRNFTAQQAASTNFVDTAAGTTNAVNFTFPVKTTYQPGDSFDYGLAIAMALNPTLAINLQMHQSITDYTRVAHFGKVQGSTLNEASVSFGFAWAVAHNVTLNFNAAAGLTEDTPDMSVSLAVPIRF